MIRLHSRDGFGQRFNREAGPTPYLHGLEPTGFEPLHRSRISISSIRSDLLKYGNDAPMPNDPLLRLAVSNAHRDFKLAVPIKMLHLNEVFQQDLPIWSSSPGLPWKDCGYKTKGDIKRDPEAVRRVRKFWHKVKRGEPLRPPDSLAYVRSHLVPIGEEKVRAVWGYPATMTFGEAVFALPLINAYKKCVRPVIAYGYETAIGGFSKLYRRFVNRKRYYCLDFKSFDKTLPEWLINYAFDILEYNIDFSHYQGYGVADARWNHGMFDYIRNYFIHTTIRMCNGERYRKNSGVASGSYFTQLIDSICNAILVQYWCLKLTGRPPVDYIVFGDDSLVAVDTVVDIDDINDLMQLLGMKLNLKKSMASRYLIGCTFLGYEIGIGGLPSKPENDLLASLFYPEFPDKEWDNVATRALGLMYANLGVHSGVHHLCEEIVRFKHFDLHLSRNQQRFLNFVLGIDVKELKLKSQMSFFSDLF